MIDMVFQLIIFFMVTANFVKIEKTPDVVVPVAPEGKAPEVVFNRVIINVFSDEKMRDKGYNSPFGDAEGKELTYDEVTEIVREKKQEVDARNDPTIRTTLHLRGDYRALVRRTKEALQAAADAGVSDVVFAAFERETEKHVGN